MGNINNIACPECYHSWDQDGPHDYTCRVCGTNCEDQILPDDFEEDFEDA